MKFKKTGIFLTSLLLAGNVFAKRFNSPFPDNKIFEDYKGRRRGLRVRLNRAYDFEDESDEERNATRQLVRVADYLDNLPVSVLIYDNIEADDVIGYLAKEIFKQQVVIMSTDKDFLQLVDDRISIYNPTKKKVYYKDDVIDLLEQWVVDWINKWYFLEERDLTEKDALIWIKKTIINKNFNRIL